MQSMFKQGSVFGSYGMQIQEHVLPTFNLRRKQICGQQSVARQQHLIRRIDFPSGGVLSSLRAHGAQASELTVV